MTTKLQLVAVEMFAVADAIREARSRLSQVLHEGTHPQLLARPEVATVLGAGLCMARSLEVLAEDIASAEADKLRRVAGPHAFGLFALRNRPS